jgi:hypothetical protein
MMQGVMLDGQLNRMKTAKKAVADSLNEVLSLTGEELFTMDDIYIVWFCKTLQNWKALLSTDVITTGVYFEVTYNGDKNEMYLDHYTKVYNEAVPIEEDGE